MGRTRSRIFTRLRPGCLRFQRGRQVPGNEAAAPGRAGL